MQVSDDPRVGTELAGYRIESLLGWGGMSVVYLAEGPAAQARRPPRVAWRQLRRLRHEDRRERAAAADEEPLLRRRSVWSPDGRGIAFRSTRDGNPEIYVMNADGSGQRNVTRSLESDGWFAWRPT